MAADSVRKRAISTPFGLSEFLRMPFGLRNAGQTFQRMMDKFLQWLEYCFCYMDNMLVASTTEEENMHHLAEVMSHLQQHGLVLNGK